MIRFAKILPAVNPFETYLTKSGSRLGSIASKFTIMTNNKFDLRFGVIAVLILLVALTRLVPFMYNFAPLGALGLFGAAYFKRKSMALLIPLAAVWISDVLVNNILFAQYYGEFTWFYEGFYWQYGSYLLIALFGLALFKKVTAGRVLAGALGATAIFFLVSNFGAWVSSPMYPKTPAGLFTALAAGLPFIKGSLLGNLLYSAVLFGSFSILQKKVPALHATAKQEPLPTAL